MSDVNVSNSVYTIFALREKSQFGQHRQVMRCKIVEVHREFMIVESLKRYNKKYAGASKTSGGVYKGRPIRRVNKDQALVIIDEKTNKWLNWETVRRREGTLKSPGRARGGK